MSKLSNKLKTVKVLETETSEKLEKIIDKDGNCLWYKDGLLNKVEFKDGTRQWYRAGILHREDRDENGLVLPAIEKVDVKYWYKEGKCHREDRDESGKVLPAVEFNDGTKQWYKDGMLHREEFGEDGLALASVVESSGNKCWYKEGFLHRIDGPAVVCVDGREEWWLSGVTMKKENHPWWLAQVEKQALECNLKESESPKNIRDEGVILEQVKSDKKTLSRKKMIRI